MHGEEWDGNEDLKWMVSISCFTIEINNRWISEKMDGIRAYWNGEKLISKHSKEISCPNWFIEELPKGMKLDGELWMGRGNLRILMAILNHIRMNYHGKILNMFYLIWLFLI